MKYPVYVAYLNGELVGFQHGLAEIRTFKSDEILTINNAQEAVAAMEKDERLITPIMATTLWQLRQNQHVEATVEAYNHFYGSPYRWATWCWVDLINEYVSREKRRNRMLVTNSLICQFGFSVGKAYSLLEPETAVLIFAKTT